MRRAGLVFAALAAAACSHDAHPVAAPDPFGAITVLARDRDSGEIVPHADLVLRGPAARTLTSSKFGFATFEHLPPGRYDLIGTFAAQPVELDAIVVRANETEYVDLTFTLGQADPIRHVWGDASDGEIRTYRPRDMNPTVARIEGNVSDHQTHARVAGAVVTATDPAHPLAALQAVTDDQGRYRLDDVAPGTYAVSAYYNLGGRGQIEVRRSGIVLAGGDAVVVPLAIEIAR